MSAWPRRSVRIAAGADSVHHISIPARMTSGSDKEPNPQLGSLHQLGSRVMCRDAWVGRTGPSRSPYETIDSATCRASQGATEYFPVSTEK